MKRNILYSWALRNYLSRGSDGHELQYKLHNHYNGKL